jgi:hypothetical protein
LHALVGRFDEDTVVDLKVDLIDLVNLEIELSDSGDKQELVLEVELIVIVDVTVDLDIELVVNFVELKVKL